VIRPNPLLQVYGAERLPQLSSSPRIANPIPAPGQHSPKNRQTPFFSSLLVGKNVMFHPYAQVYGYVDEATDSNRAPPTCLWSKEFYETNP
jgi:hypothetical protein